MNADKQILLAHMKNAKQYFGIFRAVYIISWNRTNPFYACSDRNLELFQTSHSVLFGLLRVIRSNM